MESTIIRLITEPVVWFFPLVILCVYLAEYFFINNRD